MPRTNKTSAASSRIGVAKPGPKPRLTKEEIVAEACRLLSGSSGELTMAKLAASLNVGVMSLYRYYPSRESLLDAVAEHFIGLWQAPAIEGRPWQDIVFDWLKETQRLWDEHPEALRVIFWNSPQSASWIRVWLVPLARMFKSRGVELDALAFALNWLGTSAVAVIVMEANHPAQAAVDANLAAGGLSSDDRKLSSDLTRRMAAIDRTSVRRFNYENIVAGLERLLEMPSQP
ncbi:TetR/AcrR family transcriptional regulator [Sphingomonas crocodyli]|nr:TetR/AcrR family transcriptional regulator [Sphingomonas crocodyli]